MRKSLNVNSAAQAPLGAAGCGDAVRVAVASRSTMALGWACVRGVVTATAITRTLIGLSHVVSFLAAGVLRDRVLAPWAAQHIPGVALVVHHVRAGVSCEQCLPGGISGLPAPPRPLGRWHRAPALSIPEIHAYGV